MKRDLLAGLDILEVTKAAMNRWISEGEAYGEIRRPDHRSLPVCPLFDITISDAWTDSASAAVVRVSCQQS